MKLINRFFVALMVVLSVFAVQSCGGNQQNGASQEEVSDDKPTLQELVDESGVQLPMNLGEGLTLSDLDCSGNELHVHIYIPSPVSIQQFEEEMPFENQMAEFKRSYNGDSQDPMSKLMRSVIDNDYDVVYVFDNTEETVEYVFVAPEVKK